MKQAIGRLSAIIVVIGAFLTVSGPGVLASGPKSVADLAERLRPAVVNIVARTKATKQPNQFKFPDDSPFRDFFEDFFDRKKPQQPNRRQAPRRRASSLGSGFVIDPSGIIVTNNHVIDKADEIDVVFKDGSKLKAKVLGRDKKTDIAVLQVKPKNPLPFVRLGDSSRVRVGDWVMAIGNPFGLGGSVSLGIVSAHNRDINSGPYDDFIQTDAAINKGNSGGPLFNMDGEVIGINTAIISPSGGSIGIGFSIPTSTAKLVIEQLRKFGTTRRGWLGVRIQAITDDLAESLGLKEKGGALVADLTPTGPAETAGIKAGDVILEFDGKTVKRISDLPRIVARTPVGKSVDVVIYRKGEKQTIKVTLGRLEDGEKLIAKQRGGSINRGVLTPETVLGMRVSPVTDELRKKYKLSAKARGIVVLDVKPDSPAADKRIQPGDIIAEAGEKPIRQPSDLKKRIDELKKEGRGSILLLVLKTQRGGDPHFIALKIN